MQSDKDIARKILELLQAGKYDELLKYCSNILKKNPRNINATKNKAYALYFLGRYKESLRQYDKAIDLDPQDPTNHAAKSQSFEKLGRHEEAKKCYNEAIRLELDFNIKKFLSFFER